MKLVEGIKKNKFLVVVLAAYMMVFIVQPSNGLQALNKTWYYVVEMLEIVPIIFVLTALLDTWVPKEVILKQLGNESGIKGVLFAFLLGSFSAGPIYAAFPISKLLLKKGASIQNVVIILSAWAVIKVPMLLNEVKFLGAEFMLKRWALTIIAIVIMAIILPMIVKKKDIKKDERIRQGLYIQEGGCIGCGICAKALPTVFEVENKKAHVIKTDIEPCIMETLNEIIKQCPVHVIEYN